MKITYSKFHLNLPGANELMFKLHTAESHYNIIMS